MSDVDDSRRALILGLGALGLTGVTEAEAAGLSVTEVHALLNALGITAGQRFDTRSGTYILQNLAVNPKGSGTFEITIQTRPA